MTAHLHLFHPPKATFQFYASIPTVPPPPPALPIYTENRFTLVQKQQLKIAPNITMTPKKTGTVTNYITEKGTGSKDLFSLMMEVTKQ
jgi:hypothetical protein